MPNRGFDPVPDFVGFANAPVDEDGNTLDFRDVDAYDADRDEAVKAPSSIGQFKTNDKSTDGFPAAVVPAPVEDEVVTGPPYPDFDNFEDNTDNFETPADEAEVSTPDADPAEGEEGTQS